MRKFLLAFLLALAPPAFGAEATTVSGTIVKFECGDNCWLTIRWGKKQELMLLCRARECDPWNEATAIPRNLIGRRIVVTLGAGPAVDGNGDIQDYALAALSLKLR